MGAPGAVNLIFRKDLETADDQEAKRAQLIEEYTDLFANPYIAAERGYVDDVIDPRETRRRAGTVARHAADEARAAAVAQARQRPAVAHAGPPARDHTRRDAEEVAAIVVALGALRVAPPEPEADDTLHEWVRTARLTARRSGLQRGPWRLSGASVDAPGPDDDDASCRGSRVRGAHECRARRGRRHVHERARALVHHPRR